MPSHVVSAVEPDSLVKGQSGVAPPGWNKPRLFLQLLPGTPTLSPHRACLQEIVAEQRLIAWGLEKSPDAFSKRWDNNFNIIVELSALETGFASLPEPLSGAGPSLPSPFLGAASS